MFRGRRHPDDYDDELEFEYVHDYDYDSDDDLEIRGDINVNNFVHVGDQIHQQHRMPDFHHGHYDGRGPSPGPGPDHGRRRGYRGRRGHFDDNVRQHRPRPGHHRMTTVRLPGGGGCHVIRRNIARHLPRAHLYTHDNLLDVDRWMNEYSAVFPDVFINWNYLAGNLTFAMDVLFRTFDDFAEEDFRRLFDVQQYRLDRARGPWDPIYPDLLNQMHAVSCICDQDVGLGCSEALGSAVMELAVAVVEYLPYFARREHWKMLFASVCRVLSDNCPRQEQMVVRVWDSLPDRLRRQLGAELAMSLEPGARRTRRALERVGGRM